MSRSVHLRAHHTLGLTAARALAQRWRQDGETRYGLVFSTDLSAQTNPNQLNFSRIGLKGQLRLSETSFELDLELGHFLSPFKDKIEAALSANLQQDLQALADTKPPSTAP